MKMVLKAAIKSTVFRFKSAQEEPPMYLPVKSELLKMSTDIKLYQLASSLFPERNLK